MVTPELFRRFPDSAALARADQSELEALIRSTGFFRAKSRNLLAMARKVVEDHGGDIPNDLETLTTLPGVGRKTANVVLGTAFGIASGVVVDTHVKRLARRLGLSTRTTPEQDRRARPDAGRPARWVGRFEPSSDPSRPPRLPGAASPLRDLFTRLDLPKDWSGSGARGAEVPKDSA